MTISQVIDKLAALREKHGDLPVRVLSENAGFTESLELINASFWRNASEVVIEPVKE